MRYEQPIALTEILRKVDDGHIDIVGDEKQYIYGFNDDFVVENHEITWTQSDAVLNKLLKTEDNVVIVTNRTKFVEVPDNKTLIITRCPLVFFEKCADVIFSMMDSPLKKTNEIGVGCQIHETSVIGMNVKIGDNCIIGSNVVIGDDVIIGNYVIVQANTVIGTLPYSVYRDANWEFYNRKIYGTVIIEDNVQIGVSCSVNKGITGCTKIGRGSKLGDFVEIAHDVEIGRYCCFSAQVAIAGYVNIGDKCSFWGKSGVANRISIASRTSVLAASIVTKDIVCEGGTYCGFPAQNRIAHWKKEAAINIIAKKYQNEYNNN